MMSSFVMASTVVLAQAGQGMFKFVKHDSVPVIVNQQSCPGKTQAPYNSTFIPGHCYLESKGFDSDKKFIGSTKKVTCAAGVATVHVFEDSTNCSGTAKKPICDCNGPEMHGNCYSCDAAGSSKYVSPAWTNGFDVSCKSFLVPSSALLLPVKCWHGASYGTTITENADGTLKLVRIDEGRSKCDGTILDTATLTSGTCSSWEDAVKATVTVVATSANGASKKNGSSGNVVSAAPSFASVAMSCVATVLLVVED